MKLVVAALKEFVKKYFQDMDIFHFAIFCLEISNMPVESSPEAEISIYRKKLKMSKMRPGMQIFSQKLNCSQYKVRHPIYPKI